MILDLNEMDKASVYHTMTQTLVPRPIAWVLSESAQGALNLAPFSYFTAVCSDPPLIMISVGKKPSGEEKDTFLNIIEQKQFVIHIADEQLAEAVTLSSKTLPRDHSEVDLCGLQTVNEAGFALPRLVGPKIAMACKLHSTRTMGALDQNLIFGQMESIWIDDHVLAEDAQGRMKVMADQLKPLGRLGGSEYQTFGNTLSVARPK